MPGIGDLLKPVDLKRLKHLQVRARQMVEGFCSGLHRSPHKGFSVEFKQHRQYVPGDEIRRLDWKVFGKTDRFFIREYEEETNLRCTLVLDKSGSMAYRGARASSSKFDYAVHMAAALASLLLEQQDAVGLVTFDDEVREHVPPRARPAHLNALVDYLQRTQPGNDTDMAEVFRKLVPKIHRRGLVLILSDCFGNELDLIRSLSHLRSRHHEVVVFQVWDRDELEFPFFERLRFDSLEDPANQRLVDAAHLRESYLEVLRDFRAQLEQGCARNRVDLVPLVTDKPWAEALAEYLAKRRGG